MVPLSVFSFKCYVSLKQFSLNGEGVRHNVLLFILYFLTGNMADFEGAFFSTCRNRLNCIEKFLLLYIVYDIDEARRQNQCHILRTHFQDKALVAT